MVVIDPLHLFFAGQNGEVITVVVKSENTVHAVNANLDGQPAQMQSTGPQSSVLTFTLDMASHDPSRLVLLFNFFNTMGGGLYKVLISGSAGGSPFGMLVPQPLSGTTARVYTFDVV